MMKNRILAFAISVLAVGCVTGSAFAEQGFEPTQVDRSPDGGIGNFPPGLISCYEAGTITTGPADAVWIAGPGTLAFLDPDDGREVLTTEACIVNAGAADTEGELRPLRSSVQCSDGVGGIAYFGTASAARVAKGVTAWRDWETHEVYLSTLACRIHRLP